jgi:hypothetical protein
MDDHILLTTCYVANMSGGFQNDILAEILSNVRVKLSQIDIIT